MLQTPGIFPPLIAALPFIFMTIELHVIPAAMLQGNLHPRALQISKYFLKSDIAAITEEYEEVKKLGSAATEEWTKGLDGRGKQLRASASRWERWTMLGGLTKMRNVHHGEETSIENDGFHLSAGPPSNAADNLGARANHIPRQSIPVFTSSNVAPAIFNSS